MKDQKLKKAQQNLFLGIVGSLTLGLAPFFPEPHITGKMRWALGGGVGMSAIDWFDLVMHGAPWVFLGWALMEWWKVRNSKEPTGGNSN